MTQAPAPRPNPILAGLRCRCPNCGRGPLFAGFLKVAERCRVCGFDLKAAESGDGPAVFIILIVGCVVVFAALFVEIAYRPALWLDLVLWGVLWLPLTVLLSLGLMRPFKGVMVALQFHHHAAEVRNDDF
jgi:uncharacterized protein (DUF983 family)